MLKKIFLIIVIFQLFGIVLLAQYEFPSAYYPSGAHPRIWINTERLLTLRAARVANTAEWQRFYNQVTVFMDPSTEIPTGWPQWTKYSGAIPYTALMYQLTGDTIYAAKTYYFALKADTSFASSENYWIGNCEYLGCGYDWIYDYMNAAQKTAYRKIITTYAKNMWHVAHWDGYRDTYTSMDSDRNTLGMAQYLMFGCAIYGDDNYEAVKQLNRAWLIWTRGTGDSTRTNYMKPKPVKNILADGLGGIYYTGLAYYMGTDIRGMSHIFSTLRTACNYDLNIIQPELKVFWKNLIRGIIDQTDPPQRNLLNVGDWQDSNDVYNQPWIYRFLTYTIWEASQAGDEDWAALGRGYKTNSIAYRHADQFSEFFFSMPGAPETNPYTSDLPTIRTSKGIDYLIFRNNWSTSATYGAFSGQGGIPLDHQSEDPGCFTLYREDDYLTKTLTGYRDFNDASFVYNNLSIENGMPNSSPRVRTGGEKKAGMDRHRENNTYPKFAYGMMQGDGQWNLGLTEYTEDPTASRPVKTYRRHFFWSGDYVIIFDRLRAKKQVATTYRLRALTQPTLDGQTINQLSVNGHQRLLHRTLEPLGVNYTLFDETTLRYSSSNPTGYYNYELHTNECKWQYRLKPAITDSLDMLNVIQMGPASMTQFDEMESLSNTANVGVHIGKWNVVFSRKEVLRDGCTYNFTSSTDTTNNLIGDLQPGSYYVYANGHQLGNVLVNNEDNTAYFTTTNTGVVNITLSSSALPVELTTFTGSIIDNKINLTWNTATEKNNFGFYIERKIEKFEKEFKQLGFISGLGNSNIPNDYYFIDSTVIPNGKIIYRLKQVDLDGTFCYSNEISVEFQQPLNFSLMQNYPNPFNPSTTISYEIPVKSDVELKVYDILGKEITTLVNCTQISGFYTVNFNANKLSSGVYIYQLTAGANRITKKMVLVR